MNNTNNIPYTALKAAVHRIIQRNIADQAKDTLAECALLHQTLEGALDDHL